MLSTIKSKILALTVGFLLILSIIMITVSTFNYQSNKDLIINGNKYNIESYTEQINNEISRLEDNAVNLASLGEFYYQSDKDDALLDNLVVENFQNYAQSMGCGIWFKPYTVNANKRLKAVYAYKNQEGKVILDQSFETDEYNYPMQRWYLEIMPHLSQKHRIVWSTPYYESQGSESLMTTVGVGLYHQDKLIGLSTVDWQISTIVDIISEIKPTKNSFVLFADKKNDFIISTTDPSIDGKKHLGLSLTLIPWYHDNISNQDEFTYHGKVYIPYVKTLDNGMMLIVNIPKDELFHSTIQYMEITLLLLLITCVFIAGGLYIILQRNINKPIAQLTAMANEIGQGNLNMNIHLEKPQELSNLAKTLNKMTQDLKTNLINLAQMSKAKEKMEAELSIAHNIQKDALPIHFPVNPSFEIIASMTPARDVGGDFYDFFFVDETHFAFVMADVSGKGITAALFMMSAKTMIKNILQSGYSLDKVAKKVNQGLYDNNSRGMFVTAFISVLDLQTGVVNYINAGHCPPAIKSDNGYTYLVPVRNLMLGISPSYQYQLGSFTVKPNDRIFLYTDGVTEAQTKDEKLFGSDRLLKTLNRKETPIAETLDRVKESIKKYVKDAEQSDDITMMELLYHGPSK